VLPVAVDAMGGDDAPGVVLEGVRRAVAAGIGIVLVGLPDVVARVTDLGPGGEAIAASEVIGMSDDPAAGVRRKKDSSLVRAAEAVRDGRACAMVSAGNTGAAMAASLLRMGRIRGVNRPAIATAIPRPDSLAFTTLLDCGANAEVQPEWLVQFAQMGTVFARRRLGVAEPTVGLMSIGEESSKGSGLVKETHDLLSVAPAVRFVGNVEGRDVLKATADVIVTDGFTGNVILKTLEGGVRIAVDAVLDAAGLSRATAADSLGALLHRIEPSTHGGSMLLGVDGVSIISHGSSDATAIESAIRIAVEMVDAEIVAELRAAITTE
jgi:phosphate acyltransferase